MAHIHDVVDTDVPLRIDSGTRKIINHSDNTDKKRIMQGDHNCEILTFQLDRYIDGHDMTLCNLVRIHYVNVGEGGQRNEGVEYVNNLDISEADEDIVEFTWQISGNVTKLVGPVNFCVEFTCVSDGFVVYTWKTAICNHLLIEQSIDNSEIVGPDYIISVDSIPYTLDDQNKLKTLADTVEGMPIETGTGTLSLQSKEWVGDEDEEPRKCLAEGLGDVSLGLGCYTNGKAAIALGKLTSAPVSYATALGLRTTALGNRSTAMGQSEISAFLDAGITEKSTVIEIIAAWNANKFSLAKGVESLVEGANCLALDRRSFASGYSCVAFGPTARATGMSTTAISECSWANGGSYNSAITITPHLNTSTDTEEIYNAWVNNKFNLAFATGSLTYGYNALALGKHSSVFGWNNVGKGDYSSVFGFENVAEMCSFVAGNRNNILGTYSAGFGSGNELTGTYSFIAGRLNKVFASDAFAGGKNNTVSGAGAVSFGANNTVSGDNTFVAGSDNEASGGYASVFGINNIYTSVCGVVSGARNNVSGTAVNVSGLENTVTNSNTSLVAGRNNTLENALCSIVFGRDNVLKGEYTSIFGYNNVVNNDHNGVLGLHNKINAGTCSFVIGNNNVVNYSYSQVLGRGLIANRMGVYLGMYNLDLPDTDLRFVIGKGTSDTDRANLMEYRKTKDTLDIYATEVKFTNPEGTSVSVYDMANTISTMQTYIETLEAKITTLEAKIEQLTT